VIVKTVFAPTLPPLGPARVTVDPLVAIVPDEEGTVTELDEAPEDEVCEQVNFPACVLVVALQAPPVHVKVIQVGLHWQFPDVIAPPAEPSIKVRAAASAVQAAYSDEHWLELAGVP